MLLYSASLLYIQMLSHLLDTGITWVGFLTQIWLKKVMHLFEDGWLLELWTPLHVCI